MVYYPILESELAKRGIKKKTIAEAINVCSKSLNNKMTGRVPFTLPEAQTIIHRFFPDFIVDDLFARADEREGG